MNRKGQALIEFVLILPLFIFLITVVYDFGLIYSKKNNLENCSNDIIELLKKGESITEIEQIYPGKTIEVIPEEEYNKITVKTNVKVITPGLNKVLGDPYKIEVSRYVPNEE